MRKLLVISFLLVAGFVKAQVSFRTLVPQQPVVEGEPFRVQYVAENADNVTNFIPPSFNFRLVSGPEVHVGKDVFQSQTVKLENTIYTLEARNPGRYLIPGAIANLDGKTYRSNDVWIEVISREENDKRRWQNGQIDDNSAYFLKPGEDPYEKIRQNLFVRVMVDKKSCYTGEPVVATFKLYSRLESRSDIVKNPGFYGFTVYDMINLDDKMIGVEKINGKSFDVHTIRKVQLYPLQSGIFTIDPMEIKNKVELFRSAVNKKTEHKVVEGVFEDEEEKEPSPGAEVFENSISTEAVTINVKPAPAKNKPADFNGATGVFTIQSSVEKKDLARNEEGYLVITIKGKGNFTQLTAPVIQWPGGIEGFDPAVSESLDKSSVPLNGSRSFRYAFVSSKPGAYVLPAVSFSFFDPDSNKYRTIKSSSLQLSVSIKDKVNTEVITKDKVSLTDYNRRASLIAAGIVVALVLIVLIYWLRQGKEKVVVVPQKPAMEMEPVEQLLKPVHLLIPAADKDFYSVLQQAVWKFLDQRFGLSGSVMNKQVMLAEMKQRNIDEASINELLRILGQCEAGIFTNAVMDDNKEELVLKVEALFTSLDKN